MNNNLQIKSVSEAHPHSGQELYYKLVCIDQQHAIIACQQLNAQNNMKAVCLGRAVVVSIDIEDIDAKELAEINYLLSSVRVHAMAYDEELTRFDKDEIEKN